MPLWIFGMLIAVIGMFSFCVFSWLAEDDFLDEGLGFGFSVSGFILALVGFAIFTWGWIKLEKANSEFKKELFSEENYKETIPYDDLTRKTVFKYMFMMKSLELCRVLQFRRRL